ncbi:LamG domain-containing protein, partial [Pseudomonas sp. BGM005]|nr:LamG domain-containing protein [Pseudomonas sp. BG5]
ISQKSFVNPAVYSTEAWFKTTTNSGGKIIGFGNGATGNSSSYDRHVYMTDAGRLVFGTWTGQTNTITTDGTYNNGQWHHVVAT